jgi:hypothetical protein
MCNSSSLIFQYQVPPKTTNPSIHQIWFVAALLIHTDCLNQSKLGEMANICPTTCKCRTVRLVLRIWQDFAWTCILSTNYAYSFYIPSKSCCIGNTTGNTYVPCSCIWLHQKTEIRIPQERLKGNLKEKYLNKNMIFSAECIEKHSTNKTQQNSSKQSKLY